MKKYAFGFIGCGNMGGALVRAVANAIGGENIAVNDFMQEKARAFESLGATVLSASELVENSQFLVLGVKPQNMEETVKGLIPFAKNNQDLCVITMAAGVSTGAIKKYFSFELPVIRIMPNTPAMLGQGMILYTLSSVSLSQEQAFLSAFSKAGVCDKIPEEKIDAASALSGCGPAFVYAFAEALADGAVECGVPREQAATYAAQTLKGAAEMLLQFGHPAQLKDAVCSPGGTTIAGIHALENAGFRGAVMDAITSAYKRTLELKK